MALVYTYGGETGYTDGTSGVGWAPQSFIYGGRVTFLSAGTIDQLGTYAESFSGTRTIKYALYDTSENLVSGTSSSNSAVTSSTPIWYDGGSFTAVGVSAADYFILYSADTHNVGYGYDTSNDGSYATEAHGDFPAGSLTTFVAEGDSAKGYGGRANFTAAAAPPFLPFYPKRENVLLRM